LLEVIMKKFFLIPVISLFLIPAMSIDSRAAQEWTGNANLLLGVKFLDEIDWEPLDQQAELGIDVDFRKQEWPVNLAVAFVASRDEDDVNGIDLDGSTAELRFGIRKIWEPDQTIRPFFGGGLVFLRADLDSEYQGTKISDDDTGVGIWLNGGIYWTLNRFFNLGFNLGLSTGEVTLFGYDTDAGGFHTALILGYHW
jgi:hypothetical protein